MLDPRVGDGGERGLGVVGDAEAGGGDHGAVVGAVADGKDGVGADAEGGSAALQGGELGLAAEDRAGDLAGQEAVGDDQAVGAVAGEAGGLGDAARRSR